MPEDPTALPFPMLTIAWVPPLERGASVPVPVVSAIPPFGVGIDGSSGFKLCGGTALKLCGGTALKLYGGSGANKDSGSDVQLHFLFYF